MSPIVLGMGAAVVTVATRAQDASGDLAHALRAPGHPSSATRVHPGERQAVEGTATAVRAGARKKAPTTLAAAGARAAMTGVTTPHLAVDGAAARPAPSTTAPSPSPAAEDSPGPSPTPTASSTPVLPLLTLPPMALPTPTIGRP